jgi:hypothetical protein
MPPDVTEPMMNVFEEKISFFSLRFFWEARTAEISKNNFALLTLRSPVCP